MLTKKLRRLTLLATAIGTAIAAATVGGAGIFAGGANLGSLGII